MELDFSFMVSEESELITSWQIILVITKDFYILTSTISIKTGPTQILEK